MCRLSNANDSYPYEAARMTGESKLSGCHGLPPLIPRPPVLPLPCRCSTPNAHQPASLGTLSTAFFLQILLRGLVEQHAAGYLLAQMECTRARVVRVTSLTHRTH